MSDQADLDKPFEFMNLNNDCQISILENSDLQSLISLSESSQYLKIQIWSVINRRFGRKWINFSIPYFSNKRDLQIYETDDEIKIRDIDTMIKVLRYFGPSIRKLELETSYSPASRAYLVYKYINIYCSDRLTQFNMKNSMEAAFDEFKKPFKNIESISLHGQFDSLNSYELRFSEIFPSIRYLSLRMVHITDPNWVTKNIFPNMEHLHIYASDHDPNKYFKLIKNNPQIRSLKLENVSRKELMFVAQELPKLERLEIDIRTETEPENSTVSFGHLKVLKVRNCSKQLLDMVSSFLADKLEELEIDKLPMDFMKSCQRLKKLNITQRMTNLEIQAFSKATANLSDISLICDGDTTNESIFELIDKSQHLERLNLIIPREISRNRTSIFRKISPYIHIEEINPVDP